MGIHKNRTLNILLVSVIMMTLLLGGSSQIKAAQDGDFTYLVTNGKAEVTGYTGAWGDVIIPSTLGGYPVTSIGIHAFAFCGSLTSIIIPESVKSIGPYAFEDCTGLTSVTIPQRVTSIDDSAFSGCKGLTSIAIPQSVTSIGSMAFYFCTGLTNITIPQGVTSIGYYAFNGCTHLTSITFNSATTRINDSAYTIPDTAKIIGYDTSTAKNYAAKYSRMFEAIPLQSIAITTPVAKLSYAVGDTLDITGLVVTGTYSNGCTRVETITSANISGFDSTKPAADKVLTITVGSRTATYKLQIHATPAASNVTISGKAQVGQTLTGNYQYTDAENDAEGASTFKWYRSSVADGTQLQAITGVNGKSYKLGTADQYKYIYFEVTPVSSTGKPQGTAVLSTASDRVELIKVTGVALENITVAYGTHITDMKLPAKISINLSDGSNVNVPVSWDPDTHWYDEPEGTQEGTHSFTGTLDLPEGIFNPNNIQATLNVTVLPQVTLQSIAITRPAAKLNYVTGDTLDITGLVVTGTYSDGSTKVESITASNVTGFNSTAAAKDQVLTVTVGGKTATYKVQIAAAAKDTDFSDVSSSFWGYNAIKNLSSKGIVSGYPDGTFKPDATITRAEFATMLVKAVGLNTGGTTGTFMDVPADAWYYGAVNAAASAGLVSGMGNNLFAPNALITREQMAVMVAHALGNKAPSIDGTELNAFSDKSAVSSWAVSAMGIAVKSGIVSGMSGNTISPLNDATRAQAAVMIYKMLFILGK